MTTDPLPHRDTCKDAHPTEWGTLCTRRAGHTGLQHTNHRTGAAWSTPVDVHAMGVLADLQAIGRCLTPGYLRLSTRPAWWPRHPDPAQALAKLDRRGWRRQALKHRLRLLRRNATRRSSWHGYHAEPATMPPGLQRIGTGWTRRRAMTALYTELGRSQA